MSFHKKWIPLTRTAVFTLLTQLVIGLNIPAAWGQNPCPTQGHLADYPVIVYDANTRNTFLGMHSDVDGLIHWAAPPKHIYHDLMLNHAGPYDFLCDARPVEVYVFNRRLLTSFTISLTSAFNVPTSTIDLRGTTPQAPAATPAAPTTAATSPAAKGFQPVAAGSNLLTTDQVVGLFLDDETFEKALTKVADDAAAVQAQALQFRANHDQYVDYLNSVSGIPGVRNSETPLGVSSLRGLADSWNVLKATIETHPPDLDETLFSDWIGRADRLQTEVSRVYSKIQVFPVVDSYINLQASAAILKDNYRGVQNEKDAVLRALDILHTANADYLFERQKAELRTALRARYTGTAVTDATLARIVDRFAEGRLPAEPQPPKAVYFLGSGFDPCFPPRGIALPTNAVRDRFCAALASLDDPKAGATPASVDSKIDDAHDALASLRDGVNKVNEAEGDTLRAANDTYDTYRAPVQVLNLNLQGYSGNLFVYYTISRAEQFNRYQIENDILQPLSNCALAITANVNLVAGINPCTTASTTLPVAPSATYSSSQFPPLSSASTTPASTATAAPTTNASTTAVASSVPADYYGHFQMHHFSHGALITGAGYDSVATHSFNWIACSTNPNNSTGNLPGTPGSTGPCISPSVTSANPTPLTYYQLVQSKQAQVAAIAGVDLFVFNHGLSQDMFPGVRKIVPELFLGAAAYPLNHYYVGISAEPERGFNVTGGVIFGSQTTLPSTFGYSAGSYAATNPSIPSSSAFKTGFFVMVGFDTSLFVQIFNGSIFQGLSIGSVGSSTPTSTPASGTQ